MTAPVLHVVGTLEHWRSVLARRIPVALCGEMLHGDDPALEPTPESPTCRTCLSSWTPWRLRLAHWQQPMHRAVGRRLYSAPWIGWEVTTCPDGSLEGQALAWWHPLQRYGTHMAWVHGADRAELESAGRRLFPESDHDFLWNTQLVTAHHCGVAA